MLYAQIKSGQKLHIVYELPDGALTQPVCGKLASNYRMTINLPLGNGCKNCRKIISNDSFDINKFIINHLKNE